MSTEFEQTIVFFVLSSYSPTLRLSLQHVKPSTCVILTKVRTEQNAQILVQFRFEDDLIAQITDSRNSAADIVHARCIQLQMLVQVMTLSDVVVFTARVQYFIMQLLFISYRLYINGHYLQFVD